MEGQVPPDVGTDGPNLGKGWGRWEGREKSPLQTAKGRPEALGQDEVFTVLAGERLVKKGWESQTPNSRRPLQGASMEISMHFHKEQTNHRGKTCVAALVLEIQGAFL